MMRTTLLASSPFACTIAAAIAAIPMALRAQSLPPADPYMEFGISPDAVMTLPIGTLESIRGSIPCSPVYAATTSVNLGIGLHAAYVVTPDIETPGFRVRAWHLEAGYDDLSSLFEVQETTLEAYDAANGRFTEVETEQTALYTLHYIRTAAEIEFALGNRILLRGGPSFSLPLSGSSRESRTILSPSNATFLDRTQEITIAEGTGELDDPGMRFGVGATLAYRLPLGRKLYFEPRIGADFGITPVQPSWSPLLVRGGISVGYGFVPDAPIAPPPAVREPVAETPQKPKEAPFAATPRIDVAAEHLPIEFRRQIVARYVPVLTTVFFDRNSSTLPERYITLAPEGAAPRGGEAVSFDETQVPANAERAHYQTLNIFGRRLQREPNARATITGTTGRDEENRPQLAAARAQEIAGYLTRVWGIAPGRITVRSRVDPAVPSNSENPQGLAENRRVELDFNNDAIYRPLQLRSVEPTTDPEMIPFRVSATSTVGIERWRADITTARGAQLGTLEGGGEPAGIASWRLSNADRERVLETGTVSYQLTLFDSVGRSVSSTPKMLPVRIDTTITVASSQGRPDNAAEFLLVTFDFDRADLTRRGRQELEAILDRIGPDSRVEITGYTDPIGEIEHNRTLAAERARKVASLMPKGTYVKHRGAGPDEAPYNSGSPEGRFLSRTVRVVVNDPK